MRGRSVRAYSDETTFVTTWTRNPAWCVLDYMTNSMYGMGAYITTSDANIQSFIDFATLCTSQVPNGAGGLEDQHMLDIIMDTRRPHWTWVLDLLANYRSTLIYSQQQWKVISDRADLPLRQVFHSGNMVPGRTTVRIASNPAKPNQANVTFANANLDYEMDPLYVQDSASVLGANDPIKDFDMSILGITRESEALRAAAAQLDRARQVVREVSWTTGLEALAVEPGDMARVGIKTYGDEMGVGGRVLEDSMESRTLANTVAGGNSTAIFIVASPTAAFNVVPQAGDRWAIGITSEDLMLMRVKSVGRNEAGQHELVGEQFVSLNVTTPSLVSTAQEFNFGAPPSQPIDVKANEELVESPDGTIQPRFVVMVTPSPREMGGRITSPGTTGSVTLAQSQHPTPDDSLNSEPIRFITGAASGYSGIIGDWGGATRIASVAPPFVTVPASGDAYSMTMRGGDFNGFDLYFRTEAVSAPEFVLDQTVLGVSAVVDNPSERATSYDFKIVPFSTRGVRNQVGNWEVTIVVSGDITAPATPSGLSGRVGTGRAVDLSWDVNTEGDLSYYELHRNTSDAFGTASKMAHALASKFTDVNVSLATSYFYWIRAVDRSGNQSPIHPGSTAGVFVVTSAITQLLEAAITTSFGVSNSGDTIAAVGMTNAGGNISVVGKCSLRTGSMTPGTGNKFAVRLTRNGIAGTLIDLGPDVGMTSSDGVEVFLTGLDTPPSGVNTYAMFIVPPIVSPFSASTLYAIDRKILLGEINI